MSPDYPTVKALIDDARTWSRRPATVSARAGSGSRLVVRGKASWGPVALVETVDGPDRVTTTAPGPLQKPWPDAIADLLDQHDTDLAAARLAAIGRAALYADSDGPDAAAARDRVSELAAREGLDAAPLDQLRDYFIREALDAGVPAATAARLAGVSRVTVYRSRDKGE